MKKNKFAVKEGEVLIGSALLKKYDKVKDGRVNHMVSNMNKNKAFLDLSTPIDSLKGGNSELLNSLTNKFAEYRVNWKDQPKSCIRDSIVGSDLKQKNIIPLCIDIETAAVCDLACPFCFREYYATPDKLIDPSFCYDLIDQAAELGVPSIKFNWRGEPLLHPKLPDFISYAKSKGILETIINTNATTLSEKRAIQIIESGLDFMIYSFDGGSKETYEKMRPGRFSENTFEKVYSNIKNFHKIKEKMGSVFPYTKIQMIMTSDTFEEKDSFFKLFSDCVDDVSVSQYTERGGELKDIDDESQQKYKDGLERFGLPKDTPYMRDVHNNMFLSKKRKPCEQPFQRLMISYEGRVGMCCYDWGATHPVGYMHKDAYTNESVYDDIVDKAKKGKKGFELLSNVEKSKVFNSPPQKVESLKEIWFGEEINKVRKKHTSNNVDDVEICSGCTFKDTYEWISLDNS